MVEQGLMIGTALAPVIGYDAAADIAKEAAKTGRTIREVARGADRPDRRRPRPHPRPRGMTEPGFSSGVAGG